MSKTIYVIGPVSGIEDCNRQAFRDAAEWLTGLGHTVITPFDEPDELAIQEALDHGRAARGMPGYQRVMKKMLAHVMSVDELHALHGWDKSDGARIEVLVAQTIGTPVFFEDGEPIRLAVDFDAGFGWT